MSIVFASFKHLKLPISVKMPVTMPQIVDINMTAKSHNLDFINYSKTCVKWPLKK